MVKIAIFASGNGSNAENIIRYFKDSEDICVSVIVSNNRNAYVHQRALECGIPSFTFTKEEFEKGDPVIRILKEHEVDFIVLAGFMLKITYPLLEAYPERIVNIHPALLPKYGGKGMYGDNVHKAVVLAKEPESGITVHYVNEHYDEGNIIFQVKCDLHPDDTHDVVAQKVHALEYEYFPRVIEKVAKRACRGYDDVIPESML